MDSHAEENIEQLETQEWLDSLDYVIKNSSPERVKRLFGQLQNRASKFGIDLPYSAHTPYINTIPRHEQPPYPGKYEIERRIKSIIRWNAMAMVVKANRLSDGIGGHISTFASSATLYEVGFNHFFKGKDGDHSPDQIYFQGHASPGIYARAFLEGRITEKQLENFRRELAEGGGLSSYPHPWLMPDFWEFPTVSMGLGPLMAIYQARFNRYLENRGLRKQTGKVWAFLGDGEMDEPESLGAISLAGREQLDNLVYVINCNLQRLDGPVRGNGKIIQELEGVFRGAGWNVIKVIWGSDWDPLLNQDKEGRLVQIMNETIDGEYQKYKGSGSGAFVREHFFGKDPEVLKLVENYTDEQIWKLHRGGHDSLKVYAAYHAAMNHKGSPTVILAKTVKGYGLGESGEGKNITHSQKKLNEEELREFRSRFGIPISDEQLKDAPFYKLPEDSHEMEYLHQRRQSLGGSVPSRRVSVSPLVPPPDSLFKEFDSGSKGKEVSTTMVYVRLLSRFLKDKNLGQWVVPIIPDEARTFGMEGLFNQYGIYSYQGQKYDPVDSDSLMQYREARDGQVLEEGITEAGAISSFIAAGTAYATHGVNTIPFFAFYSMFGLQRVGDFIWAAGDMRCKGFMIGATAGRTTLAGEGLQHQDGHSHVLAYPHPNLMAYDPAFAYELAAIIKDGIQRMYVDQEDVFYYITVGNEPYEQPAMPEGVTEGILKGLYCFQEAENKSLPQVQLLGSGAILPQVLQARELLKQYNVESQVWSVTSYKNLFQDALDTDRWNLLNPESDPKTPYVAECLKDAEGPVVAASDYSKVLPYSLAQWIPQTFVSLGTDGFGRSESRDALREFFEVNARYIAWAALVQLAKEGKVSADTLSKAKKELDIDPSKANPMHV